MKDVGSINWTNNIKDFEVGDLVICRFFVKYNVYNEPDKFEYSIGRIVKLDDKHIRLDNWNYGYNIEDEDLILHLAKIEQN